jgi:hypothetical protein
MAAATHKRQGAAALLVLGTFWLYATVWLLITPFYENALLTKFFPDRVAFITLCVLLGTAFLVTVSVTTGVVLAYYPNLVK